MTAAGNWWRRLSPRERILVATMVVLLVVVLAWLGVVRPLAAVRDEARARQQAAQAALADVADMAAQIRAARGDARTRPDLPLLELVRTRADAAGLTIERLEKADGNGASLRIAAVRSPALLGWLAGLEAQDGLAVERLAIARNDDATLAVDLVIAAPVR